MSLSARQRLASDLDNVDVRDLIDFADAYSSLGDAVQEQLRDILDGDFDGQNSNAIRVIKREMGGVHNEIDEAVQDYFDYVKKHKEDD